MNVCEDVRCVCIVNCTLILLLFILKSRRLIGPSTYNDQVSHIIITFNFMPTTCAYHVYDCICLILV